MTPNDAQTLAKKIRQLQAQMVAYSTGGRTQDLPDEYRELFAEVTVALENAKYANPNPHKSLELFFAHCGLVGLDKWAQRRAYVDSLYADVLLDLKRAEMSVEPSKQWSKANESLQDELVPVRSQWLKAKNFTFGSTPDFENAIKESVSSIESALRILTGRPKGTLGDLLKDAQLDKDVERLVSQAYGYASNRDGVRHGGTLPSTLTKAEAEFFLNFAAASITYLAARAKRNLQSANQLE